MVRVLASLALALMLASAAADPLSVTGPSRIIDGDTVVVGTTHVQLKGVDAAELRTDIGEAAKVIMETIVNGSPLRCILTGEKTWGRDVGWCFTETGVDINKEIIAQGAALACPRYDTRYVRFEQAELAAIQTGQRIACRARGDLICRDSERISTSPSRSRVRITASRTANEEAARIRPDGTGI